MDAWLAPCDNYRPTFIKMTKKSSSTDVCQIFCLEFENVSLDLATEKKICHQSNYTDLRLTAQYVILNM